MSTDNRTALVTGASGGIGAAIAKRLVSDGNTVICADIDIFRLDKTVAELGPNAVSLGLDIADPMSIQNAVSTVERRFGRLDILVNNAGISDSTSTGTLDITTFRHVIDVNLIGAVELTLGLLESLQRSQAGRILNIASVQALVPAANSLSYATAKGGLVTFTRALAVDLAPSGILVNALAPGFIDTAMAVLPDGEKEYDTDWFRGIYIDHGRLPLRRPGSADEVASTAAFLLSLDNTYVTGQILAVDGGLTATF